MRTSFHEFGCLDIDAQEAWVRIRCPSEHLLNCESLELDTIAMSLWPQLQWIQGIRRSQRLEAIVSAENTVRQKRKETPSAPQGFESRSAYEAVCMAATVSESAQGPQTVRSFVYMPRPSFH